MLEFFKKRQTKIKAEQFRKGFDYAAGILLRGEKTAEQLENEQVFNDEFDKGINAAVIKKELICNNT